MTVEKSTNRIYKGIVCIIISAFCFAVMNACVRMAGDLPVMEKAFFRNIVALVIAATVLISSKESFIPQKKYLPDLILRSICGTTGILCNFYAQGKLDLSDASILNKMSPFFSIIFSVIILKEKINFKQIAIVTGAFIGALFVIKPNFANAEFFPSMLGFIGGIGAGIAYTFVRRVTKKGCNKSYVVFFFSAFSTIATLPFLILNFKPMSLKQFIILCICGIAAAGGQYFITFAYSFAAAKDISVYDYSQIIFAMILGYFLFGQLADMLSIIGYIIIISMAILMFVYEKTRDKSIKKRA